MRDITDSIEARANFGDDGTSFGQTSAQTPIITVVATIAEDVDHTEAQRIAGMLRQRMAKVSFVENVQADHTVNSFGIETITALNVSDIQDIKREAEKHLRDDGYTVEGVAVQAEIKTSSL